MPILLTCSTLVLALSVLPLWEIILFLRVRACGTLAVVVLAILLTIGGRSLTVSTFPASGRLVMRIVKRMPVTETVALLLTGGRSKVIVPVWRV